MNSIGNEFFYVFLIYNKVDVLYGGMLLMLCATVGQMVTV